MKPNALPMAPIIRRPVELNRAHFQRRKTVGLGIIVALVLAGAIAVLFLCCGDAPDSVNHKPPPPADDPLTQIQLQTLVSNASYAIRSNTIPIADVACLGTNL